MLKNIIIFTLGFFLSFCSNRSNPKKAVSLQLDSLLNFETIIAVYSHSDQPLLINDDKIGGTANNEKLYIDSINRWSNSKQLIDSLYFAFPKLTKYQGVINTVCCGQREILIQTSSNIFKVSWNINTADSSIYINTIPFCLNKRVFNRLYNSLDRKIITKEILLKDTIHYSLNDIYNIQYDKSGFDTRLIYLLK